MMLDSLLTGLRGQAAMRAEILALRHQLTVLQRSYKPKRLVLQRGDRCLWVWLSRLWSGWRSVLFIVKPETVIGRHHQGFRWYWTWKIRHGRLDVLAFRKKTFLDNHLSQLASVDFFTVHTVWFEVLFVFIVLAHDRRRLVHFIVTAHPTAEWTAQQLLEAFPFETAPKYLLRDRDRIYGQSSASKSK